MHREAVHPYLARLVAVLGTMTPFLLAELVSRHFIDALYLRVSENTIGLVRARDHWELLLGLALKCGLSRRFGTADWLPVAGQQTLQNYLRISSLMHFVSDQKGKRHRRRHL